MSSRTAVGKQPGNGHFMSNVLYELNMSLISSVGPTMPSYFSIESDISLNWARYFSFRLIEFGNE